MSNILFKLEKKPNGKILWTQAQIDYIIKLYNAGNSLKFISNQFQVCPNTIRILLKNQQVFKRGVRNKYPLNEDYFQDIDTPDQAYWLGILYADGYLHSKTYSVALRLIDLEHIEKFKIALGANNHKITCVIDNRFSKESKIYCISMKSQKLFEDLCHWKCVPQKSLILKDFPDIPNNLLSHFIRGYFDGDGSIHQINGKQWRISFCGTYEFLTAIKNFLGVKTKISSTRNKSFLIQINGNLQLNRILNLIYQDSNVSNRLDRKYKKYLTFISETGASLSNL